MGENQSEEIRAIIIESARVQVATLSAAIAFWSGWVDAAGKFVQAASRELVSVGEANVKADDVVGRLTDSSREYLRRLTELPNVAVAQFNAEVKTGAANRGEHTRAAKAKD